MKKTIKKALRVFNYLLISGFVLVIFFLFANYIPGFPKIKIYRVISGSMTPKIPVGSIVFVRPTSALDLKNGDVINFKLKSNPNQTVTHRIISIQKTNDSITFKTKGDANKSEDIDSVITDQLNGKVVLFIPLLGYISAWLKTPIGLALLIFVPAIFIIFSELISLFKAFEEYGKKTQTKTKIFTLFIVLSSFFISEPTNAYFSNSTTLKNNTFSTGYWESPKTWITNESFLENQNPLKIFYQSEYDDNLDYVQLCYSFNLSTDYQCPDDESFKSTSGFFEFKIQNDGIYSFYTLSHAKNGSIENSNIESKIYTVEVDTTPPTSNFDYSLMPVHQYSGLNLLNNGDFENGMYGWNIQGTGEHHIVQINGSDSFLLGFKDGLPLPGSSDGVFQIVTLPANTPANLSFKYHLFSEEISDYSKFVVQIRGLNDELLENILIDGNTTGEDLYNTGWKYLGKSLASYANRTIKLWFGIINSTVDSLKRTWVYVDDVKISPIDPIIGDTISPIVDSNDLGSGILSETTLPPLNEGENNINFGATDVALNPEINENINIIVQPKIVLNKIVLTPDNQSIELFNNSTSSEINELYFENESGEKHPIGSLNIGNTESIKIEIPKDSSFKISTNHDTIYLKSGDSVLDKTTFINTQNQIIWQRSYSGLGNWIFTGNQASLDLSLVYRKLANKISLSIFNIPQSLKSFAYEIIYQSDSIEKSIFGNVVNSINSQNLIERDFYLGTCSTGGTCTPDPLIGGSISVIITDPAQSNSEILNKTLTIEP